MSSQRFRLLGDITEFHVTQIYYVGKARDPLRCVRGTNIDGTREVYVQFADVEWLGVPGSAGL